MISSRTANKLLLDTIVDLWMASNCLASATVIRSPFSAIAVLNRTEGGALLPCDKIHLRRIKKLLRMTLLEYIYIYIYYDRFLPGQVYYVCYAFRDTHVFTENNFLKTTPIAIYKIAQGPMTIRTLTIAWFCMHICDNGCMCLLLMWLEIAV